MRTVSPGSANRSPAGDAVDLQQITPGLERKDRSLENPNRAGNGAGDPPVRHSRLLGPS